MPRHIKIGLVVFGLGLAVTLGFFVDIVGRIQSMAPRGDAEENPFTTPAAPLYQPSDPPTAVKIFFPDAEGEALLTAEDRIIFQSAELVNRAKQILQLIQEGPETPGLTPSLPRDAKAQELFLSGDGLVFVDFSSAISVNHPGGVLNEQATIYSIVNSLTYNLSEIQQVKILVGGVEKETLAGHCLLLLPLEMDLAITTLGEPEFRFLQPVTPTVEDLPPYAP